MYRLAILNTHPIQYFAPLYRRLAQEPEIDLTVYFCSRQGSEEYLDAGFGERIKWDSSLLEGYEHKFLRNIRRKDKVDGFWSLINPQIISELRTNGCDAFWINGHNHFTYLIGIGAARLLRIPVFMRCDTHLQLRRSVLKRVIRKPLMHILYNHLCDACLPVGTLNRDFYLFHGVEQNRLFTVPFTVNNEYFVAAANEKSNSQMRTELGLPADKPLILFASKLTPGKRPMDLLDAYGRLCNLSVEAGLLVVGSGAEETALRAYVQEKQLPRVYFVGFKNQSELPKFYSAADVFVLPSENESWGLVLNEVMCSGLPVIVSRGVGAAPDLVRHGQNGFVYETGDVEALTDFLFSIVTSSELRDQMGQASREIISNWNNERCVDGLKEALASTTQDKKRFAPSQIA